MIVCSSNESNTLKNITKEESAELIETIGNTFSEGVMAFGTLSTGIAVTNAPSPTAKTVALGVEASSTVFTATGFKVASKLLASKIRKASDSFADSSSPPSPGDSSN